MQFYKYNPFSLVDSPYGSATIIYTCGCELNCQYCFNTELRDFCSSGSLLLDDIRIKIKQINTKAIDWLIISGGEPLFANQFELHEIINIANEKGLKIGLYTTAYECKKFDKFYAINDIIDYFHIDYKGPIFDKNIDIHTLQAIYNLQQSFNGYLHVNTTIMKGIHTENVLLKMKDNLLKAIRDINISCDLSQKRIWTITPINDMFYNKTLGKLDRSFYYTKDEFKTILKQLRSYKYEPS